jgi:hypothetical protein
MYYFNISPTELWALDDEKYFELYNNFIWVHKVANNPTTN